MDSEDLPRYTKLGTDRLRELFGDQDPTENLKFLKIIGQPFLWIVEFGSHRAASEEMGWTVKYVGYPGNIRLDGKRVDDEDLYSSLIMKLGGESYEGEYKYNPDEQTAVASLLGNMMHEIGMRGEINIIY